jgi:hypothetical protein
VRSTPDGRAAPRRRAGRAWLALALACALGAAVAQAGYYPAQPGMSWTYSNGETQTLSGPRDVLGAPRMVLTHYFDGVPVSEEILEYGAGVVSHGTAAGGAVMAYTPPLTVYPPEPLQPGDAWQSTTTVDGVDITLSSEVLGLAGVRTPAGRFNALRIRQTTLTSSGGRTVLELFFVPTVGVVRFVTQDGTTIDLIERGF